MTTIHRVLGLVLISISGATCSHLQTKEAAYLNSAMGSATQTVVRQELGAPTAVQHGEDGRSVWVYEHREQQSGNLYTPPGTWCEQYLLTFDDKAVLQQWRQFSHFHGGELMPTECIPGMAP